MLQWGEYDKSKPKPFATSISDEQYESLSLQGSIKMIESRSKYPIELGLYKKNKVMLCKGPYGLYLKHNGTNFKIIEEKEVTLAEAKDIIDKKIDKEFPKTLGKLNRKDIKLCTGP